MRKHFMVDIETTGTNLRKDDILQIGILELEFLMGSWRPGKSFEMDLYTNRQPESQFAKEHQAELYERCRKVAFLPACSVRAHLLHFLQTCGVTGPDIYFMGWNAAGFDLPFLAAHAYLEPHRYEQDINGKDVPAGDFHYRIYELQGAISLAENVLGYNDRKGLIKDAEEHGRLSMLSSTFPGKQHDALFDCYRQTQILNGLITLLKGYEVHYKVDQG